MEYITLGRTELQASRLGCGCSRTSSLSSAYSQSEIKSTLYEAYEQGINFFDTANIYGQGDSERMLGQLFKKQRHELIFSTKAGLELGVSQNLIRFTKPFLNPIIRNWQDAKQHTINQRKKNEKKCFQIGTIKSRIHASLKRLNTDYIDLFFLHSPPVSVIEDEHVFSLLCDLQKTGKIRYVGVSCDTIDQAMACLQRDDIDCLQIPINLSEQEIIKTLLPQITKQNIAIVGREPFNGGQLLNNEKIQQICQHLPGTTPAELLIQYVLQFSQSSVILVGMNSRQHLLKNINVLDIKPPAADVLSSMEQAALPDTNFLDSNTL